MQNRCGVAEDYHSPGLPATCDYVNTTNSARTSSGPRVAAFLPGCAAGCPYSTRTAPPSLLSLPPAPAAAALHPRSSVDEDFLRAAKAIDPTAEELLVRRLASVFWHNCFPEGIYPEAALFNHACDPNCSYTVDWSVGVVCTNGPQGSTASGQGRAQSHEAPEVV